MDIHDFKIPSRVDIGDIAPSSYISCMYNLLWCVGFVNKVDEELGHVYVQFMHPHRPHRKHSTSHKVVIAAISL